MTNYSTLGRNLKRGIFKFCGKLSKEFGRPIQKFITDMIYGLLAGQSCKLTEIARELKEKIALDNTVERLSRNLNNDAGYDAGYIFDYFIPHKESFIFRCQITLM